jgi:hypothetical protein
MHALEERLREALRDSMKVGDPIARTAIRSALAAIDNAGAVSPELGPADADGLLFAHGVHGLGAGDVGRRELDAAQIAALVRAEVTERERAAREYDGLGRTQEADRLRSESRVLERLLMQE